MKKTGIILIIVLCCFLISAIGVIAQGSKPANGNAITITATEANSQTEQVKTDVGDEDRKKIKRIMLIEEQDKRILRINDEKGKVIKEIKIGETVTEIKEKDREGRLRKGKHREIVDAAISEDNKAIVVKYNEVILEGLQGYEQPETTLEIKILDNAGDIKWRKEIGKNRWTDASRIKVTDNNLVVVKDATADESAIKMLRVFNDTGEEIFTFPGKTGIQGEPDDFSISPNGKYIGINYRTKTPPYKHSVIFFNLSNGRSWDLGKDMGIRKIGNDGKANCFFQSDNQIIDLKSKLEE